MDELDSDGTQIKSPKEFLNLLEGNLKTGRGKAFFILKNNETIEVPNRGIRIFPCRAILRIGMFLRDSEATKNIGTQLLNQSLNLVKIYFKLAIWKFENLTPQIWVVKNMFENKLLKHSK